MGFVKLFNRRRARNKQLSSGYSFLFGPTSSGRAVTEQSAMQMTAVYSCVRILPRRSPACRCTCTARMRAGRRSRQWITRCTGCCMMSRTRR